ncbi:MAG: RT0821/Lpp0805 family surface protein [Marivibrio sp.]|uniref:RT0821/Lpp0805 family surface protein n=1 Tax=Marivibrio sp. TaxID=2039719 RepID=UPI0032EAE0C4
MTMTLIEMKAPEVDFQETRRKDRRRRAGRGLLVGALALALTGCISPNSSREDKLASGTIAGAAAGALIGYSLFGGGSGQWVAAFVLGAAGGYAGYEVTDRLTVWDRRVMQETAYFSLTEAPAGETAAWRNPDTGSNGTITPLRTYLDGEGRICRDYAAMIEVEGERYDGEETACRNAVGAWVVG